MAVSEENDDQIFGWAILQKDKFDPVRVRPNSVFYMYVREPFRKKGIGLDLLNLGADLPEVVGYANLTAKGDAFIHAIERKQGVHFALCP